MKEMNKEIKREIKLLAKQKKFDQIYEEYGPYHFRRCVSIEFKILDVEKLVKEEKFEKIYEKYGETYQTMQEKYGIGEEDENLLAKKTFWKSIKRTFLITFIPSFLGSFLSSHVLAPAFFADRAIKDNAKKYEKEIKEYEEKIKEYSKKFDPKTQSDMEIIMRTMKDMHETIRGYGTPEIDATGYLGIDVMDKDGIGVCRNMAPNIADKLNAINPEYNARIFALYNRAKEQEENNIENFVIEDEVTIRKKGNIRETYEKDQLLSREIEIGKSSYIQEYEEGKIKRIALEKANKEYEINYDENENIVEKSNTIMEKTEDKEIKKIFVNGRIKEIREKTDQYYKNTFYDENERKIFFTIADAEMDRTIFYYENGQKNFETIVKDGYKTTIYYDEQEEEIERKKEKTEEENIFLTLNKSSKLSEELEELEKSKEKTGNHVMTAVDIKSDNVTLLVDPTNLSLGIYKDGKMYMFNERQPSEAVYDRKFGTELIFKGTKAITQYPADYIKSFLEPKLSIEELEKKYGLQAQNKMLEQIEKEDSKTSNAFKEELKIDTGVTYNLDTNVVTIDRAKTKDKGQEH